MQVAEPIPAEMQRILDAACAALVAVGVDSAALEAASRAARLVGALTEDAALATGVLLLESGSGALPEKLPAGIDPKCLDAARELSRLGEFGGGTHWQEDARLDDAQAEVLRKMLLAVVADPRLVVARIGMQLARLRAAKSLPEPRQRALAAEARAVFGPLANRLGVWQVKWELEDLAFRYLEAAQYRSIAAALAERRADRERYIADLQLEIGALLRREGIEAEVYGRPKHIYSIYRKMQQKRLSFEQLFDVRAVRIVCGSLAECYAALGAVHGRWTNLPEEFDDYIATPKGNFYRSIHTAVIGPGGKSVEIQIRTREMHEQAELGVAAHWRYKEGGSRDTGYERKIERLRELLAPAQQDAARDDPDFIDRIRSDLFEDRVYALTPRGEIVDLPRGATPLDFAYQVHTSLGHRCRGAKINGRIAQLTQTLANGQVVEIIAGKQESPSRDWLILDGYLASPRSRAKLRSWFRHIDAAENEAGEAAQLYRWLGEGEVSAAQLVHAAERVASPTPSVSGTPIATATPAQRRSRKALEVGTTSPGTLRIEGVSDLPLTLAKCCLPAEPAPVAGYVTLGRGVTVHAERCGNLQRMRAEHPERCLSAAWDT